MVLKRLKMMFSILALLLSFSGKSQGLDSVWIKVPVEQVRTGVSSWAGIGAGLELTNKIVEWLNSSDCDELKLVKASKKSLGFVDSFVKVMKKLDEQFYNGEIDAMTYYYSRTYVTRLTFEEQLEFEKAAERAKANRLFQIKSGYSKYNTP